MAVERMFVGVIHRKSWPMQPALRLEKWDSMLHLNLARLRGPLRPKKKTTMTMTMTTTTKTWTVKTRRQTVTKIFLQSKYRFKPDSELFRHSLCITFVFIDAAKFRIGFEWSIRYLFRRLNLFQTELFIVDASPTSSGRASTYLLVI